MGGKFIMASETRTEPLEWGSLLRLSMPSLTGAAQLSVLEASFAPGKGHNFHMHPDQEEMLYVLAGEFEQWVDQEKRVLRPGDCAFVPPGMVHASFNIGPSQARLLAIFGPCVGEGFTTVEMADKAPWNKLAR